MEYESLILPDETGSVFPGHVTEDALGVSHVAVDVDVLLEPTEG